MRALLRRNHDSSGLGSLPFLQTSSDVVSKSWNNDGEGMSG